MWKHHNCLLWICINSIPVSRWGRGISLRLERIGICLLATPFAVTIWEFFCPAQRVAPVLAVRLLAGGSRCASRTLCCFPRICGIWQLAQAQASSGQARIRTAVGGFFCCFFSFVCIPIYLFWGEGKKLNKMFCIPNWQVIWCFLLAEAQCNKLLIRCLIP